MKYTRQDINLIYKYWFDNVQKKNFFSRDILDKIFF